jgi:hypothetical protein
MYLDLDLFRSKSAFEMRMTIKGRSVRFSRTDARMSQGNALDPRQKTLAKSLSEINRSVFSSYELLRKC